MCQSSAHEDDAGAPKASRKRGRVEGTLSGRGRRAIRDGIGRSGDAAPSACRQTEQQQGQGGSGHACGGGDEHRRLQAVRKQADAFADDGFPIAGGNEPQRFGAERSAFPLGQQLSFGIVVQRQLRERLGRSGSDPTGQNGSRHRDAEYGAHLPRGADDGGAGDSGDQERQEIEELTNPRSGVVVLAFLNILGARLIPRLVKEFRERHPDIRFELEQGKIFCSL